MLLENGVQKKALRPKMDEVTWEWRKLHDEDLSLQRVIENNCRGTIVQRQFRTKFEKQPSSVNCIRKWYTQFQETGDVCIPELKVQTVQNELDYRVDVCRITKGAHIEHL